MAITATIIDVDTDATTQTYTIEIARANGMVVVNSTLTVPIGMAAPDVVTQIRAWCVDQIESARPRSQKRAVVPAGTSLVVG